MQVFVAGKYELRPWWESQGLQYASSWSEGDWNGNGMFDSDDFIIAFQDGGYEQGPRTDAAAVPEPTSLALMLAAAWLLILRIRADQRRLVVLLAILCAPCCTAHADIYRWDTDAVIPGTEGITPEPWSDFVSWNTDELSLRYADLSGGLDLHDSSFDASWLDDANLAGANLTNASFRNSKLANANLSGANLTNAYLMSSTLTQANLSEANLTHAILDYSTLEDANLSGAVVAGARFGYTTSRRPHPGPVGVHRQLPGKKLARHRTRVYRPDWLGLQRAGSHRGVPEGRDADRCQPNRSQSHRRWPAFLDADRCQPERGGGDGGKLQSRAGRCGHRNNQSAT